MITEEDLSKDETKKLVEVKAALEDGIKNLEDKDFSPKLIQLALEDFEFERGTTGYTGKWFEEILSNSNGYVVEMEVRSPMRERFSLVIENDNGDFNVNSVDMVV